ncbi:MAG: type IV secretion system DNA-binding domain-containing protein [Candidatus Acidiferrales bacterium]
MSAEWGRDERADWPSSRPVYAILLLIVSVLAGAGVECVYYLHVWTPLQRHYLPMYVGMQVAGAVRKDGWYTLLVLETRNDSRLALDGEVEPTITDNGDRTFGLTDDAIKNGALRLEWQRHSYDNIKLHDFLGHWIYHGQTLTDFAKPGLRGMAIVFLAGLWPAVLVERKRTKELRYGRKLRGPDLVTVCRFNWKYRRVRGIGFANEDRSAFQRMFGLNKKLFIPLPKENRHFEFIGDSGGGKTQLIIQQLVQIEERKEVAIIHDPEREYTPRFYKPERGDVILYPYDKRMPFWSIGDEIRSPAEASAVAASLFPERPNQDAFFWETSRKIFAYILTFKPTPRQLIYWMSHPEEIDRLVEGTPYKAMITRESPDQRNGVIGSLNRVADAFSALPSEQEASGRWSTVEWAKNRQGYLFFPGTNMTRDRLMPLYSLWLDLLVMRTQDEGAEERGEKLCRVWFILDEVALLQKLPKLHDAITRNRKTNNPIVLGFQGRSQLRKHYGIDAEVMFSQPATKIFLRTSEPESAKWISDAIGEVEIEQVRESRTSDRSPRYRQSRSGQLERRIEPLVLPSEIMGLEDRHGYLKFGNAVVRLRFPYLRLPKTQPAIIARATDTPLPEPPKAAAAAAGANGSSKPNGNTADAKEPAQAPRQENSVEHTVTPHKRRFFE